MRLQDWLTSRPLRAVIVNITMLVLLVFLLRTRAPFQELNAQIRKGMSSAEVVSILGKPTSLNRASLMMPTMGGGSSPIHCIFRREVDAAFVEFVFPDNMRDLALTSGQDDSFWIDSTHALVIYFEDDLVQNYCLAPVTIRPATLQEWCRYQWQRLSRSLSQ